MDPAPVLGVLTVLLAAVGILLRRDPAIVRMVEGLSLVPQPVRSHHGSVLSALGGTRAGRRVVQDPRLRRSLELAGSPRSLEEIGGLKLLAVIGGVVCGWILGPGALKWIAAMGLGAAGLFIPDLLMSRRARARQRSIELRVPDLVEVLVATAEAGLAPPIALARAPAVLHGPLAKEIERVSAEISLAVPWREALRRLVDRTEVPSLRRLVAALTRSSRMGSSVRAALRVVAEDLRSTRRVRAEELARRAPVKMLFPLVFLILPAFLLLTVGPAVLATLRSLQSGG